MLLTAMRAEWAKWTSTRMLPVATLIYLGLGCLIAFGSARLFPVKMTGAVVAEGFLPLAMLTSMVPVVALITTEYRYRYHATTFLAVPRRGVVIAAKLLVAMLYCALLAGVTYLVMLGVVWIFASSFEGIGGPDTARLLWQLPVYAAAWVPLMHGLAWLLRSGAAVYVTLLVWLSVVETLGPAIPKIGPRIGPYLPMQHVRAFAMDAPTPTMTLAGMEFHAGLSLAYFLGIGFVVLALGSVRVLRRDA